jgi:hypothetical protein
MALSASAAATLLGNYINAHLTQLTPTVGFTPGGTDVEAALASTRTNIINDIVASAQTPVRDAIQAGTMLDNYTNAYISLQMGLTNFVADGSDVLATIATSRTTILNYLTH